eukprot:1587433-Prorocentrum_lima.AAC.1
MVPTSTYIAYTLPEIAIKANQVDKMAIVCKSCMDIMETFNESLYDKLFDKEVFHYSDGPGNPPLRLNQ